MDWTEMNNAYDRAQNPTHSSKFNQTRFFEGPLTSNGSKGADYSVKFPNGREPYSPTSGQDKKTVVSYIVVHNENDSMVCRARTERKFEYDIIAYFPSAHDAMVVAKMLNDREASK